MTRLLVNAPPDTPFLIGNHEVHVWYADLTRDQDAQYFQHLLSPDENGRAARFRFPEHRRRFVIARGYLRQLMASYLRIEPCDVAFTYSETGKPELATRHQSDIRFNVSHSGDVAAFAFTVGHKVGVDVECIRYDVDVVEIPRRFFSQMEQQALAALEDRQKFQGFFNCWTRKEAYVKAVGSGLSLPLRDFDVSLVPGEPARLLATRPDAAMASKWSMQSFDFAPECAAAVVAEGRIEAVSLRPVSSLAAPAGRT